MSRTFRRNKKWQINHYIGSYEENAEDPWYTMYRYPTLTYDQAYDHMRARLTRDHHPGHYGVPRWFRRMHGSKHVRMKEKARLFRCWQRDEWDQHFSENRMRNAKWFWW